MSEVEGSVEVAARPDHVWRVVADPRNLPVWDRHVAAVEGVPQGGLADGTRYRVRMRVMGAGAWIPAEVVELRPPEYARVRLGGLLDATVETWVEPLDGDRSRLRHRVRYRFRGGALGGLAARAVNVLGARTLLRRGMQAQKRQAESDARGD